MHIHIYVCMCEITYNTDARVNLIISSVMINNRLNYKFIAIRQFMVSRIAMSQHF